MKITARRLESQGKERFARLFEFIFPDGADSGLLPWEYRAAVKNRLNLFELRTGRVLTRCHDCGKHFEVHPSTIVMALIKNRTIDCCSCAQNGSLLPIWRRRKGV